MKEVKFALVMPSTDSYVGGVVFIINQYLEHEKYFIENGYNPSVLDERCAVQNRVIHSQILDNLINMFKQTKKVKNCVKENKDIYLHIHTSRLWTFFKDMYIASHVRKHLDGKMYLSIHFAEIDKILYKNRFIRSWELSSLKKNFDDIIFLSKKTRDEFVTEGIPVEKTHVLYTFHTFKNSCKINTSNKSVIDILFMGSLDKRKGILDLLESLKTLRDINFKLHICGKIGEESIRSKFETLCAELGDRVVFHGYVSGSEKEKLFEIADLFVLPSYGEGMPIVLLEAMAFGCGIISTDVGAISEIITEQNGILVKPGDIKQLSNSIRLLASDRDKLTSMQLYNYETSKKYYIKEHVHELSKIYNEE